MNAILTTFAIILAVFESGQCFTKYGRSCKDIGCPGNQECVMQTDPCSYSHRENECGTYPTCKKKTLAARTCSTYVCPPSQVCRMDGDTPKCTHDASKSGLIGYDTQAANNPSAPPSEGSHNVYPQIPRGETTPRPYIRPGNVGGGGYQGGQVGSGYPGYPQTNGGQPHQGGQYPNYPGYNQGAGYGQYPQGGQYPGYQNGYNPYQQQYPQRNSGSSWTDKITDGLKKIGLFYVLLSYYLAHNL